MALAAGNLQQVPCFPPRPPRRNASSEGRMRPPRPDNPSRPPGAMPASEGQMRPHGPMAPHGFHTQSCFQRTNEAFVPSRLPDLQAHGPRSREPATGTLFPLMASRRNLCSDGQNRPLSYHGLHAQCCFRRTNEAPWPLTAPRDSQAECCSEGRMRPQAPHGLHTQSCFRRRNEAPGPCFTPRHPGRILLPKDE
jgi:hypothetical protein